MLQSSCALAKPLAAHKALSHPTTTFFLRVHRLYTSLSTNPTTRGIRYTHINLFHTTPFRHTPQQPISIPPPSSTSRRGISFNFGKKPETEDVSKFRFRQPTDYTDPHLPKGVLTPEQQRTRAQLISEQSAQLRTQHQSTGTAPIAKDVTEKIPLVQNYKQLVLNDPKTSRFRKAIIRIQDFLSDPEAPHPLDTDNKIKAILKWFARRLLYPYRSVFKFFRRSNVTIQSKSRFLLPIIFAVFGVGALILYVLIKMVHRGNMRVSRELFVRSALVDLTARLDAYGILSTSETDGILTSFGVIGERMAKNLFGHDLMKAFLQQAMSTPLDLSQSLEDMYLPESRVDEATQAVYLLLLDKLADIDPSQATGMCPPHIISIASKFVDEWLRTTREQMKNEKEKLLKKEKIDTSTSEGRERMAELNTGVTFDLSKRERRRLFWRGILTGTMLETNLVSLENETTFLRIARDYAIKGCVLRGIPDKVKTPDDEITAQKTLNAHMAANGMDKLIIPNPATEYKFGSENDLKQIRDKLTQLPYSPNHGQIDERFLNFIFGRKFAHEYQITPDLFPYLHQIAPLVLMDLATWTHPQTIFDLTSEHSPRIFDANPLSMSASEYEKIEMFNFMIEQLVQKDKSFEYRLNEYKSTPVAKDELIVLPLLCPQDSLLEPKKFGLPLYETQIEQLDGKIPSCYKDTYGAYARAVFHFDLLILRNYLEISRLKNQLGMLGTSEVRDMKIPLLYNYYGAFDRVIGPTALEIIKNEEKTVKAFQQRGLRFRAKHIDDVYSDDQQLDVKPLSQADLDREIVQQTIDRHLLKTPGIQSSVHEVSVDSELYNELRVKPNLMVDLTPDGIMNAERNKQRQKRAQQWIDNESV